MIRLVIASTFASMPKRPGIAHFISHPPVQSSAAVATASANTKSACQNNLSDWPTHRLRKPGVSSLWRTDYSGEAPKQPDAPKGVKVKVKNLSLSPECGPQSLSHSE
jgi:hypothetical protein